MHYFVMYFGNFSSKLSIVTKKTTGGSSDTASGMAENLPLLPFFTFAPPAPILHKYSHTKFACCYYYFLSKSTHTQTLTCFFFKPTLRNLTVCFHFFVFFDFSSYVFFFVFFNEDMFVHTDVYMLSTNAAWYADMVIQIHESQFKK